MLTSHEADNFNVAMADNTRDLLTAGSSNVGNWLIWSSGRWIGAWLLLLLVLGNLVVAIVIGVIVGGSRLIVAVSAPMARLTAFEACIIGGVERWLILGLLLLLVRGVRRSIASPTTDPTAKWSGRVGCNFGVFGLVYLVLPLKVLALSWIISKLGAFEEEPAWILGIWTRLKMNTWFIAVAHRGDSWFHV